MAEYVLVFQDPTDKFEGDSFFGVTAVPFDDNKSFDEHLRDCIVKMYDDDDPSEVCGKEEWWKTAVTAWKIEKSLWDKVGIDRVVSVSYSDRECYAKNGYAKHIIHNIAESEYHKF